MTRALNEQEQREALARQMEDVRYAVMSLHTEVARLTRERDAALEALRLEMWREHVPCTGTQHDPINGLIHGFCVRCRTPWPCEWCPESTIQSIETGAIHNDQ